MKADQEAEEAEKDDQEAVFGNPDQEDVTKKADQKAVQETE